MGLGAVLLKKYLHMLKLCKNVLEKYAKKWYIC